MLFENIRHENCVIQVQYRYHCVLAESGSYTELYAALCLSLSFEVFIQLHYHIYSRCSLHCFGIVWVNLGISSAWNELIGVLFTFAKIRN